MDLPSHLPSFTLPRYPIPPRTQIQLLNFGFKWLWRPTEASQLFSDHTFRVHI